MLILQFAGRRELRVHSLSTRPRQRDWDPIRAEHYGPLRAGDLMHGRFVLLIDIPQMARTPGFLPAYPWLRHHVRTNGLRIRADGFVGNEPSEHARLLPLPALTELA